MPVVIVPPPLQGPTQGVGNVEAEGATVAAVLHHVEKVHPGFADLVLEDGRLNRFVKVFHNGAEIAPDGLDREVAAGDELELVAAIAGGCQHTSATIGRDVGRPILENHGDRR